MSTLSNCYLAENCPNPTPAPVRHEGFDHCSRGIETERGEFINCWMSEENADIMVCDHWFVIWIFASWWYRYKFMTERERERESNAAFVQYKEAYIRAICFDEGLGTNSRPLVEVFWEWEKQSHGYRRWKQKFKKERDGGMTLVEISRDRPDLYRLIRLYVNVNMCRQYVWRWKNHLFAF